MFDGHLMLLVNWPAVDTIHRGNRFATSVKIKATGEFKKLNDSPVKFFPSEKPGVQLYKFNNCSTGQGCLKAS